jgi:dipeptidyl aminopeptidase/acylaminoacyl peptidase
MKRSTFALGPTPRKALSSVLSSVFVLVLFSTLCAPPALSEAAGDKPPLTVDDVIYMESAASFDISPDGKWVVWVTVTVDREKGEIQRNIRLANTGDTATVAVTRTTRSDGSPRFSPDGKKIAFLSARDKTPAQIYLYDMRGGEPEKLTDSATGVDRFEWRDAARILFTAREDSTLRERTLLKAKDTTIIVADQEHYPPVRLFEIALEKKEVTRVTSNDGAVIEFAVSPDGRWVLTNENVDVDYQYDHRNPPLQFLIDLGSGERREVMDAPHVAPFDFQWGADGKGVFCRRAKSSDSTDTYVSIDELWHFDLASRSLRRVETDRQNGLGRSYAVLEGGVAVEMAAGVRDDLLFLATNGHRVLASSALRSKDGIHMRLLAGARGGSRIVYLASTASSAPRIMTAKVRDGSLAGAKDLSPFNAALAKKTLARREIVRWKGALGDEVEGILYYPIGYEEGKRYPLVTSIHGGPAGADMDDFTASWADYPHILASKGAFVFNVNYHGSGNYGLRWVESIKGHYYEYEVPDILSGIDYLVGRGLVDPDRLGIMGWSNGSILAIESCLRSGRFTVLCAGAGDVNWTSDYGNCAFGAAFDNAYFGGPPWDDPVAYIEKSPYFRMRGMKTPTLIMFGSRDTNVPTEQGWQHFRAMQQIGEAPVRFLLFPEEGHGLQKIAHRKRKMEEELAWFDKHLFASEEPKNEAFDPSSPLAMAIDKTAVRRDGAFYGEKVNGVLVPEIVEIQGIRAGRFEVTRAQFAAFDPSHAAAAGTENYPANGVAYDAARQYCAWLSEKTGRKFRLPSADEMTKLLEAAKSNLANENNLDRWVGYSPSPDEREMIAEKIAELEKNRLLIEEAGSFPPLSAPAGAAAAASRGAGVKVYDLGGNVSEWASAKEGGKAMGLSAVSPCDPSTPYAPPRAEYIGLRVVEE